MSSTSQGSHQTPVVVIKAEEDDGACHTAEQSNEAQDGSQQMDLDTTGKLLC